MTWLPTYLAENRGFEKQSLSLFAGLPLLLSVFGDISGGAVTDWASRVFGLRLGRVGVAVAGYTVAAVAMFAAVYAATPVMAACLIAVAVAASMFTLSPSWAACMDIGGENTAVLSAAMNTTGQVGVDPQPRHHRLDRLPFRRLADARCSSWAASTRSRPSCGPWWTRASVCAATHPPAG